MIKKLIPLTVLVALMMALTGFDASGGPATGLVLSAHGTVAAVAMWLAFLPPQRYRRWIERRSQRASVTVSSGSP